MTAVLFDLDGVLVDTSDSYDRAVRLTVEKFAGRAVSAAEVRAFRARGGLNDDWDLAEAMIREAGGAVDRSLLAAHFQEVYLGRDFDGLILDERPLLEERVLGVLRGRFKLGIVTGRPRAEARFVLERFGLAASFPVLVTKDDLPPGRGKPDPLGIRLALAALDGGEALYVGDTVDDVEAARRAGVPAIAIVPGAAAPSEFIARLRALGAVAVLRDVNDILEVV